MARPRSWRSTTRARASIRPARCRPTSRSGAAQTDSDSAIDYAVSAGAHQPTARSGRASCRRRSTPACRRSRRSWSTTSACRRRASSAMRWRVAARHGGMLEVHCEDRAELEANTARLLGGGPCRAEISRRVAAAVRGGGRHAQGDRRWRAPPTRRCTSSTCRPRPRSRRCEPRAPRRLAGLRRDVPALPDLDESRYELPDEEARKYVISPPLRSPADRDALWDGLADGSLPLVATDHVPDRVAVEKQTWRESFDQISNGGPGIETLLAVVYSEGVASAAASRSSGWSTSCPRRRRACSGSTRRERSRWARTPTSSCSTRRSGGRSPGRAAPHQRLHAVRGHGRGRRRPIRARARRVRGPRRPLRRPARLRQVPGARAWPASSGCATSCYTKVWSAIGGRT